MLKTTDCIRFYALALAVLNYSRIDVFVQWELSFGGLDVDTCTATLTTHGAAGRPSIALEGRSLGVSHKV